MVTLIFFSVIATSIYLGFKIPRFIEDKKEVEQKNKSKIKIEKLKNKVKEVKKNLNS